jgi:UDP-N-acetylglucosamine acyltransferase
MKFIHPTAIIGENVTIEDDVYIGPYCLIGMPPEWRGKETESKGVYIGKGTIITGLVSIDSGAVEPTYIGPNCYIMKGAYIAHDCFIGSGVTLSAGVKLAGMVQIGHATNIGMGACVHQKTKVPQGCMIGMNAVITKKTVLKPNSKYAGVPAKFIGSNDRIS